MLRVVAVIVLWSACSVEAATQWCDGLVKSTYLSANGNLYLQATWFDGYVQICNVQSVWKGVDAGVCRGWMALATSAIATDKLVIVQYADLPSCAQVPQYESAPAPNYFMFVK